MGVGAGGETLDTRALAPIEPPDWPIAAERCMRNAPVACYCLLLLSGGWQRASVTTDSELGGHSAAPAPPRPIFEIRIRLRLRGSEEEGFGHCQRPAHDDLGGTNVLAHRGAAQWGGI